MTTTTRRSARIAKTAVAAKENVPPPTNKPVKKAAAKKASVKKAPVKKAPVKKKGAAAKKKAPPSTPAAKKKPSSRKRNTTQSHSPSPTPTKKTKLSGLKTTIDATAPLGVIDPESNIEGRIELIDYEPADVMLVLVDPANNSDKFFVLQCIERDSDGTFIVYSRWGRTGTAGQALEQEFDTSDDAIECFQQKFKQKTGLEWEERNEPYEGGKYRFIIQNFAEKQSGYTNAKWQYYVDDGVDGKKVGWYDYDSNASKKVEKLFHENANNPNLTNRLVESGAFSYDVDLVKMIQTNATHPSHTSRRIRRCLDGDDMPDDPPSTIKKIPPATVSSGPVPTGPVSSAAASVPSAAVSCPTAVLSSASAFSPSTASNNDGTHPVDSDITIAGRNVGDYEVVQAEDGIWHDVVLNQCNITGSSNSNKYYRLQLLKDTTSGSYHCWQKWGRVGEAARGSSSNWAGPFSSLDGAMVPFLKKFRDKTGNKFDANPFVPKKGKYVPIEIDNDVQVKEEMQAPSSTAKVEYLPSKLDAPTKELIEVIFSQEMRNEALSAFNLDLSRLPLGVPSEQQIQYGISILNEIEDKLGGGQVRDSYDELSSRFYTAIPHSFGRSRPPSIRTTESLQSRYDMCNILLDMFDTNETVRKIAEESKSTTVKAPPLADQHYDSLHTDLKHLKKTSKEFKIIKKYFEETKASHAKSQLLNVWEADRAGEKERFEKFSDVGNRKLLWHGTNIAVVAPILTSGLRIMPHSGGRVGSGIYLAAMQEKSAQYTSGYGAKFACMFLTEAPLGKEHIIDKDGSHASSLKSAPKGCDSVLAVGTTTPKMWTNMEIDGKDVSVPQGGGEKSGKSSSFHHDEHLCYDEAQVRIRYVLTIRL